MKRAAVCIGVNAAGKMTPLHAAESGALDFEVWAKRQGCDAVALVDDANGKVTLSRVFDAVKRVVDKQTYDQLIIYFSGHGILQAPGTEFWLLAGAPDNPNEAVNLSRSVENARESGIPHVIFISDACRSSVSGPPLSAVSGGVIFPTRPAPPVVAEVDIYYATRPGDPAYEVPEQEATTGYRAIFTDCLLDAVTQPPQAIVEAVVIDSVSHSVISSRRLKDHLEPLVPVQAAAANIKLRQRPWLRVETALPKYFARLDGLGGAAGPSSSPVMPRSSTPPTPVGGSVGLPSALPTPTLGSALSALKETRYYGKASTDDAGMTLAGELGLTADIDEIESFRSRGHFETTTGFTVRGAEPVAALAPGWKVDKPFQDPNLPGALNLRLDRLGGTGKAQEVSTLLLRFSDGSGSCLAVLDGLIGAITVRQGRLVSVSYTPSDQTQRYQEYAQRSAQIEAMRAYAAVASRHGSFLVEGESAEAFADRIRQGKNIDPVLGLYAAYAYAQMGAYRDVYSIFTYMRADENQLPVPFDVAMLASRYRPDLLSDSSTRIAPFAPMLGQGWALLLPGDPMHTPLHKALRPHLIPALWTTLAPAGVDMVFDELSGNQ